MSDPKLPPDPAVLLRRAIAAYDALQAAYAAPAKDDASTAAAEDALAAVMDDARRAVNAPQPWRRERARRP